MIRELALKPDFGKTVERFDAWWHGAILDRPPVTLSVRRSRPALVPEGRHGTHRERWLDVEFNVRYAIAALEARDWVGDSFPCYFPNLGPEITSTLLGCELEFGEHTSWSKPVVHSPEDWRRVATAPPDFDNVYWRAMERAMDLAIELCRGRFIVGMTDLHGNYDLIAGLREPMYLCTDLLDTPELVDAAARHAADVMNAAFTRQYQKVSAAGFGSTTWCPFYHEGPAYIPSCDFWCMLSPQLARDFVVPTLLTEMVPLERSLFHLDGAQALKHFDLMLALPGLNAVQWVYGAGRGPAAAWIDTYRRAQDAGKSIQVNALDANDALTVLRALKPEGVWLHIGESFESIASAHAFLKDVERLALAQRR